MKQKNTNIQSKPTIQEAYLALTEYLVRYHGLSLNFLTSLNKNTSKRKTRRIVSYRPNDLLSAKQAAAVLGLSAKTLSNWRVSGKHPLKYCRIGGAIRYLYSDVQSFANGNKRTSTSEILEVSK